MNKKIILTIILYSTSIVSMETSNSLPHPITSLTKDVIKNYIAPYLSLQTMGYLRKTSTACTGLFNIIRVCPDFKKKGRCSSVPCSILAKNFYACSKALSYCARKDVHDADMFAHWWPCHKVARNYDFFLLKEHSNESLESKMKVYGEYYSKPKKIRKRILRDVENILCSKENRKDAFIIKTLFMGSSFNIFDLIKKNTGICGDYEIRVELMLQEACKLNDYSIICALCGNNIDGQWLDYIMQYSNSFIIAGLVKMNNLKIDLESSCSKKTVFHYAAEYNWDNVIEILLAKGAYVNCRDMTGKTPLHYAAKYYHINAVKALLKSNDADPRFTNNRGKTALDYVLHRNRLEVAEAQYDRCTVKGLLQEYIKQHSQVEKSPQYKPEK